MYFQSFESNIARLAQIAVVLRLPYPGCDKTATVSFTEESFKASTHREFLDKLLLLLLNQHETALH